MYDYRQVKREHSKPINKVLSEPTMVFDFLEVKEAFFGIFCFLYFGIIETRPMLLLAILAGLIFIWPPFREKIPRGFIIHKINRYTPIKIPNYFGFNGQSKLRV